MLRGAKKDGAINCGIVSEAGPGREIGAIIPREIVTLGNLDVSDERTDQTRVAELSDSPLRIASPAAPRARARVCSRPP